MHWFINKYRTLPKRLLKGDIGIKWHLLRNEVFVNESEVWFSLRSWL